MNLSDLALLTDNSSLRRSLREYNTIQSICLAIRSLLQQHDVDRRQSWRQGLMVSKSLAEIKSCIGLYLERKS